MTADGEPLDHPIAPARVRPGFSAARPSAEGAVLCLFDGSDTALVRLRLAAQSASAAGRRLVVAHVEKPSTGFWAAAFTGYGACLGPAECLFSTTSEAAFAAAVEVLIDVPTGWDFASTRASRFRALRELTVAHQVAVIVVGSNRRLARRLSRDSALTVLSL